MKPTQSFAILIWARRSKTTVHGAPLFARITLNRRRAEISLKRKVDLDKWDQSRGMTRGSSYAAKELNQFISEIKAKLQRIYSDLTIQEERVTPEKIKDIFLGPQMEVKCILQVLAYHNEQVERLIDIDYAKSTHTKYCSLEKKIRKFVKRHLKREDIPLDDLDYKFITELDYYFKAKDRLANNTAMKYIRMLKKVMNDCVRNKWIERNPFSDFKCSFKWKDRDVLDDQDLQALEEKIFVFERIDQVRDVFLFCCYTGLSYIDVMNLSPGNIMRGIDQFKWLTFDRRKTKTQVRVPLLPPAEKLIKKYREHDAVEGKNRLFPSMSNQKLNAYLKEIADICGIDKNLTFHLARHTFATTVTLSNGVPIETVSKMLGHTKISTTQIYAKVIERKVSQDMLGLREKYGIKEEKPEMKKHK